MSGDNTESLCALSLDGGRRCRVLVLDTDVLTIIQARQGHLYDRVIARIYDYGEEVAVTIISVEEQLRGWLAFIAKKKEPADQVVAYDHLLRLLHDFTDRTLATRNIKDYLGIQGLSLIDPTSNE